MSSETDEVVLIAYNDTSSSHLAYSIMSLALIMLLLYSIMRPTSSRTEPLVHGLYGDTKTIIYETKDNVNAPEWRKADDGVYVHNARTYWKDNLKPYPVDFS